MGNLRAFVIQVLFGRVERLRDTNGDEWKLEHSEECKKDTYNRIGSFQRATYVPDGFRSLNGTEGFLVPLEDDLEGDNDIGDDEEGFWDLSSFGDGE